jgi:hypothetical protein
MSKRSLFATQVGVRLSKRPKYVISYLAVPLEGTVT